MKNIVTRKDFLTESNKSEYDFTVQCIEEFMESIKIPNTKNQTLADLRFVVSHYYERDYKEDIKNLKAYLLTHKIKLDSFMHKFSVDIYSDPFFTEHCGFLDAVLYTYDDNTLLSGDILQEYSDDDDEFVIKYNYNYDNYDLGKKFLLQKYDTIKDFYHECAERFWFTNRESIMTDLECDNFRKVQEGFLTVVRLAKGSIVVLDIDRLFDFYFPFDPDESLKVIKNNLRKKREEHIRKGLRPFNYKYIEDSDESREIRAVIVGFGDVSLNISYKKIDEYIKQIGIQFDAQKYNM